MDEKENEKKEEEKKEEIEQSSVKEETSIEEPNPVPTMKDQRKVTFIFTIIGAVIGFISFLVNQPITALVVAVVLYAVFHFAVKKFLKIKYSGKFWIGNGILVYFLMWLIVWTIFYNLQLMSSSV